MCGALHITKFTKKKIGQINFDLNTNEAAEKRRNMSNSQTNKISLSNFSLEFRTLINKQFRENY